MTISTSCPQLKLCLSLLSTDPAQPAAEAVPVPAPPTQRSRPRPPPRPSEVLLSGQTQSRATGVAPVRPEEGHDAPAALVRPPVAAPPPDPAVGPVDAGVRQLEGVRPAVEHPLQVHHDQPPPALRVREVAERLGNVVVQDARPNHLARRR
eukprot:CAMPEP_0194682486 /NCGR_PEP_ID=MMETSP0295-20121207/12796_1 /TAXON_ID=39354 /ORGANISM="Heterosigma akashiwo, Strain CCMP2393" /LENGTH=150 /DNA_ID=CAMNT_0039568849 /DNA_START=938 /DNA_END=1388 /DNA_ORIENTATION=-